MDKSGAESLRRAFRKGRAGAYRTPLDVREDLMPKQPFLVEDLVLRMPRLGLRTRLRKLTAGWKRWSRN